MRGYRVCSGVLLLLLVQRAVAADPAKVLDLRRAVPSDAYLLVYGKHNPERDYQREYYADVWKTVQETKILERAVSIVTSRMSTDDLDQAKSVMQELQDAAKPIDLEAMASCTESLYAQQMQVPSAQHLLVFRLTPEKARGTAQGIKNLFGVAKKHIGDAVDVESEMVGEAEVTTLVVPPNVPFQPTVACIGDVVLLSSNRALASQSLKLMTSGTGESKFDDPRLAEALKHLPEPEDGLVFYDGKTQAKSMAQFGPFIRGVTNNDPEAANVIEMIDLAVKELLVFDYEVTVMYTEENLNRADSYGKVLPGTENSVLMKMLSSGEAFDSWHSWVPAGAISYSLGTGANLHPLYERVMEVLNQKFPESREAIEKFEQLQEQYDIYLDRDILQAFSGEYVSVALPSNKFTAFGGGAGSVMALRCHKPDRIYELLHRGMDALGQNPFLKAQQFKLKKCEQLEGFEQLSAPMLAPFGVQPTIGFRDGWMMIGSDVESVQKVLNAKAGEGTTVEETDAFKRLKLDVKGPVESISYANSAEQTRAAAKMVSQMGAMMSFGLGMAGAQADTEDLKPIMEVMALMPDLGKIIAKFDFLESRGAVVQVADEPGAYRKRVVVVVRKPSEN